MRILWIMGTGLVGLIAVFWLVSYPVQGFTALALVPLALLVGGHSYLPRSKRAFQVWFHPKVLIELTGGETLELPVEHQMRLSGTVIQSSHFKQWHEFEVAPRRYWLLLALGIASLIGAFYIQRLDTKRFGFDGIGPLYWGAFCWMVCVRMAWRWVQERRALRSSGLALGSFSVTRSRYPIMLAIQYQFGDDEGEYRGGSFDSMFCDRSDDLTLIFYNELDPDVSVPGSALVFHKLLWKERALPAMSGRAENAPSSGGAETGR